MSSTISVSVRSVVMTVVLVLGMLAAYVVGSTSDGADTAHATTEAPAASDAPHRITMTGTGDATGVPDQLSFKLSVGATAADVATAMDRSNTTMSRVVAALGRNGVDKEDTSTTGLSIDPIYRYYDYQPAEITGYRVRQSLGVLVRSLRDGGEVVSAAVAAGGNSSRISELKLKIGDVDGLLAQARDNAVEEATAKAEQYAAATGQQLGSVLTLREVKSTPRSRATYDLSASAVADRAFKSVPIQAGSERLDVEVAVVWELD